MNDNKNVILLATYAAHEIIGKWGWNNQAVRKLDFESDHPESLNQVKHLVGVALIDVLILFIQARLNDKEATSAIWAAAYDHKCFLSKEDENV